MWSIAGQGSFPFWAKQVTQSIHELGDPVTVGARSKTFRSVVILPPYSEHHYCGPISLARTVPRYPVHALHLSFGSRHALLSSTHLDFIGYFDEPSVNIMAWECRYHNRIIHDGMFTIAVAPYDTAPQRMRFEIRHYLHTK